MTPQATPGPELPDLRLSSVPLLPRSSVALCTTRVRPMILCDPASEIRLSVMLTLATPLRPARMLPRSPTWRTMSLRSPWNVCEETRHGHFIIRSVFCVLLQVRTVVPEQGHMGFSLHAVWVIKRVQDNARYSSELISRVIFMCVHRGAVWCPARRDVKRLPFQSQYALASCSLLTQSSKHIFW
jgi:hypothetical protein